MSTPDLTPAQLIAVATALITELVNNQFVDGNLGKLLIGITGIVVPFAWLVADAIIRHGRASAHAAVEAAKITTRTR